MNTSNLSLDSELNSGEVEGLLHLTLGLLVGFFLGQLTTHGSGLLGTQISGQVLGLGVLETETFTLLLSQDGQDTSNVLTNGTTKEGISISGRFKRHSFLHLSDLAGSSVGDLLDAEGSKFGFLVVELFEEFSRVFLAKFKSLDGLEEYSRRVF